MRLSWQRADACTLERGRRFDLVLCPFNGLAYHHTDAALAAFFERVRAHLEPYGRFAFDVSIPDPALLAGATAEAPRFSHPRTGEVVSYTERCAYDPSTAVLTTTVTLVPILTDGPREVLVFRQRQFEPEELSSLLRQNGFEVLWRTSRFEAPRPGLVDGWSEEPPDDRGALLAHVCRLLA